MTSSAYDFGTIASVSESCSLSLGSEDEGELDIDEIIRLPSPVYNQRDNPRNEVETRSLNDITLDFAWMEEPFDDDIPF